MTDGLDRLRGADPAGRLPQQPDARAEDDLQLLLAEPVPAPRPARVAAPDRSRRAPLPITAVVAAAVVLVTAGVLVAVHPDHDVAAPVSQSASSVPTVGPPYVLDGCRPSHALPFQCGTYRSVFGGSAVTGAAGGPAEDALSISFIPQQGVLLMEAVGDRCFGAGIPVRFNGTRLVRAGEALFGETSGCGSSASPTGDRGWATAFLQGPLRVDVAGSGLVFGSGTSTVAFEYQGTAAIGERQLPRNDRTCVPAHVEPFRCGTFRSSSGTGSLAFLGTDRYRLSFQHVNGELTVSLVGRCNATSASIQFDGPEAVVIPRGVTTMGCPGDRQRHDDEIARFFDGIVGYRAGADSVTFRSGDTAATFMRD